MSVALLLSAVRRERLASIGAVNVGSKLILAR